MLPVNFHQLVSNCQDSGLVHLDLLLHVNDVLPILQLLLLHMLLGLGLGLGGGGEENVLNPSRVAAPLTSPQ